MSRSPTPLIKSCCSALIVPKRQQLFIVAVIFFNYALYTVQNNMLKGDWKKREYCYDVEKDIIKRTKFMQSVKDENGTHFWKN